MEANEKLIERLFAGLSRRDAAAMAECYHPTATFHDIAFDLRGKRQIAAMWRMICSTDIRVKIERVWGDHETVAASTVDEYTFAATGRRARNAIDSRFHFRDGLIVEQRDSCDARLWGRMAIGGLPGFLAGHIRLLRSWKASALLRDFTRNEQI